MNVKRKSDSELINSYIPFIICKTKDEQNKKVSLGEKAFHPDEFELANKKIRRCFRVGYRLVYFIATFATNSKTS
jgi:hypothetical protein